MTERYLLIWFLCLSVVVAITMRHKALRIISVFVPSLRLPSHWEWLVTQLIEQAVITADEAAEIEPPGDLHSLSRMAGKPATKYVIYSKRLATKARFQGDDLRHIPSEWDRDKVRQLLGLRCPHCENNV